MAMNPSEPRIAGRGRTGAVALTATWLALLSLGGCAQSAFTGWAQNSASIAPAQRPPALSALSAMIDERDDEMQ